MNEEKKRPQTEESSEVIGNLAEVAADVLDTAASLEVADGLADILGALVEGIFNG